MAPTATKLFQFLLDRYHAASGLFFDAASGPRRRFGSFATQTYLPLACYAYGELMSDDRAIKIANAYTRKLIERQGPQGQWPWFFDAVSGRVLDYYEVYSVHQYGMAPAFLERAEQHGVFEARNAIIRGFNWVLGNNQLGETHARARIAPQHSVQASRPDPAGDDCRAAQAAHSHQPQFALAFSRPPQHHPQKKALHGEARTAKVGSVTRVPAASRSLLEM
jgi:hypothetical protein